MTADRWDAELVAALDGERPGLQGAAYLLTDDPRSADEVLDAVLAGLVLRRTPPDELRRQALQALVGDEQPPPLPGAGGPTLQLIDGDTDAGRAPLVRDLARLPRAGRAAVVLRHYGGLEVAAVADLLGRTPADATELLDRATAALAATHPECGSEARLAEALRAAVPYDRRTSRGGLRDVAHAGQLRSSRTRRRVGLVVAAALVLLVLVTQLRPAPDPTEEVTGPLPAPTSTSPPEAPCDTSEGTCQLAQTYAWQTTMVDVVSSYVDPGDAYFTVSRTADGGLNPPGYWTSDAGGALALDLLRRDHGATQVSVQIATSRRYATRCGSTIDVACVSMRFMDGNRFNLTETSRVDEGMEVQFCPNGTQVITAIARNTARGTPLTIDRGTLIQLVQDPRLRLPAR